jgi:transposase-like protein
MRYPASEKIEIIKIVEQSHLPASKPLDRLGIPRRTFYRWYDRYVDGGPEALQDRRRSSSPRRGRNSTNRKPNLSQMISRRTLTLPPRSNPD